SLHPSASSCVSTTSSLPGTPPAKGPRACLARGVSQTPFRAINDGVCCAHGLPFSLMRRLTCLIVPLLFALSPPVAHGWGGTGHQIVCLIAEEHLTPHAKAAIHQLLGDASISDGEIASWADEVRR